jgi:electron transport complex protein RnfG
MSKVKYFFEQSWLLIVSAFCFGLLIAVTNAGWSERIERNEREKLFGLMRGLVADANSFEIALERVEIPAKKGRAIKTNIYKAVDKGGGCAGFAYVSVGSGFADKIKLVIAVDSKCEKFFGFKVLASNETVGFGSKIKNDYFSNQFKGAPAGELTLIKSGDDGKIDSEIVAITGATVSSEAVVKIINGSIVHIREVMEEKGLIADGG